MPPSPPAGQPASVTKTIVVRDLSSQNPVFSADGAHVAVRVGAGSPPHELSIDGRVVTTGEKVEAVVLAPDGAWASYRTYHDQAYALVHRGARIPLTHAGPLAVSSDGAHWAVATYDSVTGKDRVLLDGKEVFVGHTPTDLTLNPDGRLAFVALVHPLKGARRVHVVGGKPGPAVDGVRALHFTSAKTGPDSVRYVALRGQAESVDTLTTRGRPYHPIHGDVDVLADGATAYTGGRKTRGVEDNPLVVVVRDREHGPYRYVYDRVHDTAHVAWIAERTRGTSDGRVHALEVVVDGTVVHARDLGVRSPMDDRGPDAAGLALHPAGKELAFGLARLDGSGFELHVVVPPSAAVATGVHGEPIAYDTSGERVALLAWTTDGKRRVRISARPFRSASDGPALDKVFVETVRFDARAGVASYFAMDGTDLVRVEHRGI